MSQFLGVEIGGTKLQVVLGDAKGVIAQRWRCAVKPAEGAEGIRKQLERLLREIAPQARPLAIGVGFGGPVERATGRIARSHQIEGWSEFALASWITNICKVPAYIENDANSAALAEATNGAGVGFNPVFYITLGSGVGGGLVVDGKIYHGAKPGESEIGHVRLDKTGALVEERCSGWAVDSKIRQMKATTQCSPWLNSIKESGGEARHLKSGLDAGDTLAQSILRETCEDLAFGLSHVVHLFHPEVIVVGGGLSFLGEALRAELETHLPRFIMDVFKPGPQVRLAALGEDAVPVGALLVAAAEHK